MVISLTGLTVESNGKQRSVSYGGDTQPDSRSVTMRNNSVQRQVSHDSATQADSRKSGRPVLISQNSLDSLSSQLMSSRDRRAPVKPKKRYLDLDSDVAAEHDLSSQLGWFQSVSIHVHVNLSS